MWALTQPKLIKYVFVELTFTDGLLSIVVTVALIPLAHQWRNLISAHLTS